jgi:6-pyruvoyltetrahydropterin/6-carboxytetrahydropterin synthase
MLLLTKIFHFEMAHAIDGYNGVCKNIHGHSYELHVTVGSDDKEQDFIPAPGFVLDFKELKQLVNTAVIDMFDHQLVLSKNYIAKHPHVQTQENLVLWEAEPTAENLLLYMQRVIRKSLPAEMKLTELKLYETKNSFATWIESTTPAAK